MGEYRAVFIGVNAYEDEATLPALRWAEKDARDLYDLMTDPQLGVLDAACASLLIGADATTEAVKRELRFRARQCATDDVLIVFYAGHGFRPAGRDGDENVYFSTCDLRPDELKDDPDRGVRIPFLARDVLGTTDARMRLVMLDCCYAGKYADVTNSLRRSLEMGYGHLALMSCHGDEVTTESDELKNGRFSHVVLEALRGKAPDVDGMITIAGLRYHVATYGGSTTVVHGSEVQSIALSRKRSSAGGVRLTPPAGVVSRWESSALSGPLDPFVDLVCRVDEVLAGATTRRTTRDPYAALEAVRRLLDAESVCILNVSPVDPPRIVARVGTLPEALHNDRVGLAECLDVAFKRGARRAGDGCVARFVEPGDSGTECLAVPLTYTDRRNFTAALVTWPRGVAPPIASEIAASITASVINAIDSADAVLAQERVLDGLRKLYTRPNRRLEELRRTLFERRLNSMRVEFEPIIRIDPNPKLVVIDGWEALARDPATGRVPRELFDVADLWGAGFAALLDARLASKALKTYADAYRTQLADQPDAVMAPLAINVHPVSLVSDDYVAELRAALTELNFSRRMVVLEISETQPLPPLHPNPSRAAELFRQRLLAIGKDLQVSFALDDFGSEYSGLDRLSQLEIAHVKIDRRVMTHRGGLDEVCFLHNYMSTRLTLNHRIVLEGVDEEILRRTPLYDIYHTGMVNHIQSHRFSRTSPTLYPLSEEIRIDIAAQVRDRRDVQERT